MDIYGFINNLEKITLILAVGILVVIIYFIARKVVKR